MGLDMYLRGSLYLGWEDEDPTKQIIANVISVMKFELPTSIKVQSVRFELMYWRKSNHIHQWFVNNVQGGDDDCGEYVLSVDNLKELLATCEEVLADHLKAPDLLPTQSGFFFGSTDYDESYFEDTQETANRLHSLLLAPVLNELDITYQASW